MGTEVNKDGNGDLGRVFNILMYLIALFVGVDAARISTATVSDGPLQRQLAIALIGFRR